MMFARMQERLIKQGPKSIDAWILCGLTALILFNPFYLEGRVNIYETGLYLPGIQAILDGRVPFRDFFHLRGPFELYMPAALMSVSGQNVAVLSTYFYVGTVVTFFLWILLAKELFSSRIFFYLIVPVLVARTFPRVVFTYWGGMRFAFGAAAIFCAVRFLKSKRAGWLWAAGVVTALGLLTSVEIGVCSAAGILGILLVRYCNDRKGRVQTGKHFLFYLAGNMLLIVPYLFYLASVQALIPFFQSMHVVLSRMQTVFPQVEGIPSGPYEIISAMVNPLNKNFKHMTPAYCYIAVFSYLVYLWKRKNISFREEGIVCLAFFGIVLYVSAFRNILTSAFEMALQPEKILLFLILERVFFYLKGSGRRAKIKMAAFFIIFVTVFSLGSAMQHCNKRFFSFQFMRNILTGKSVDALRPLAKEESVPVAMERIHGMIVPRWQAEDFQQLNGFIRSHTAVGEPVLMFPDMGFYNFITERPFMGRFPTANLSWLSEDYRKEFISDFKKNPPRYAVTYKKLPDYFSKTNFFLPENKKKYDEIIKYIEEHYAAVLTTPSFVVYEMIR